MKLEIIIVFFLTGLLVFISCKKEKQTATAIFQTTNPTTSNKPPVANAGTDQTIFLPLDTTELNGTASFDPDGSIIKFHWSKVSGDFNTISQADSAKAIIKFLRLGEYVFQLEVTDNNGVISKATVKVIVRDNPAPTHSIKAKVVEYGTDLPIAGATLTVCTSPAGYNYCGGNNLSLTTASNGECVFQANKFLYDNVLKDGYFGDIYRPCFNTYYLNGTLLNLGNGDDYRTADSFIVRIVPKTDFTLHIIDSSLRGPLEGNYLTADVNFSLCGVGGVLGVNLRKGIDTTIRFQSYYGNTNYVFTVGYEPDDGGFPMNILNQQQKYIARVNNTTLNIIY